MSGGVEYGFMVLYALGKTKAINPKTYKSDDKIDIFAVLTYAVHKLITQNWYI